MARRPFRRTLILLSVALGTALSAAGGWRYAKASAPVSGPIIIISIDTLRADHLPAYGYQNVKTPAIDLLAANGVVFERAYSHAPQTLPAHTALLSGRLPFETGVRDDVGVTVRPGERLLPQLLRERGFSTAAIVSGSRLQRDTGISQGFDFFDDELPPNPEEPAISLPSGTARNRRSIAEHWLDSAGTSRVFLFLHLNEPHKPYAPPSGFRSTPLTTGKSPTRTRSSAASFNTSRNISSTIDRRSFCCPITAKASAIMANRNTACLSTTRPFAYRSSSSRRATSGRDGASRISCSTWTWCRRFWIWSRRRCPTTCAAGR